MLQEYQNQYLCEDHWREMIRHYKLEDEFDRSYAMWCKIDVAKRLCKMWKNLMK